MDPINQSILHSPYVYNITNKIAIIDYNRVEYTSKSVNFEQFKTMEKYGYMFYKKKLRNIWMR